MFLVELRSSFDKRVALDFAFQHTSAGGTPDGKIHGIDDVKVALRKIDQDSEHNFSGSAVKQKSFINKAAKYLSRMEAMFYMNLKFITLINIDVIDTKNIIFGKITLKLVKTNNILWGK